MKASFLLLLLAVVACAHATDYCHLSTCQSHTLCIFDAKNKCSDLIKGDLSQDEKSRILSKHNELRQKVARGQERQGYKHAQPAATSMSTLVWDEEIASIAQRWASQCRYGHDQCRNTGNELVGQNVAYKCTSDGDVDVLELVQMWYDEVRFFDGALVYRPFSSLTNEKGKVVGHYTQFVWGSTNKIGCGAVRYRKGQTGCLFLVCNYGPTGNMLGDYIYKTPGSRTVVQAQQQQQQNQRPFPFSWNWVNRFANNYPNLDPAVQQQQQQQQQSDNYATYTFTINGVPKVVTRDEFFALKKKYNMA